MRIPASISTALALAGLLHGCTTTAQADPPGTARLAEQIQALVGDAACDSSSQCRTVAVGARACGGPDSYLAWSTLRTDERRLAEAVRRHAAQRQAENRANRMASICSVVTDPGASCQARRCTLNPPGGFGAMPNRPD